MRAGSYGRRRVADLPQHEAVGRGDLAGGLAVAGDEDAADVAGRRLAEPDVDERADDRAHHLVAERGGPDLEAQVGRVVELDQRGRQHAPDQRRLGLAVGDLRPAAERREVVLADQRVARRLHRPEGQRLRHEPRPPGEQRVRRRRVPHVVAVVAPRRREAGVEVVVGPRRVAHGDRRRAQLVEPPREVVEVDVVGQVAGHDLAPGVDAGVGAPGAGQLDRLAHDRGDRRRPGRPSPCARRGWGRTRGSHARRRRRSGGPAVIGARVGAVRIASFNVENLFDRARALDLGSWTAGRPILEAHAELNALFQEADVHARRARRGSSTLLDDARPAARRTRREFAVAARRSAAACCGGHRDGAVEVVADGRADWIGWVELTTEPADELALRHTAMVVRDVGADVLGVVEAEDRTTLQRFSDRLLADVDGTPYEQVMLVDGNDDRGIDVGILVRAPLVDRRTSAPTSSTATTTASCSPATAASTTSRMPDGGRARRARQPLQVEGLQRARRPPRRRSPPAPGRRASPRSTAACAPRASTASPIVGDLNDSHGQRAAGPAARRTPTCATSASTPTSTFGAAPRHVPGRQRGEQARLRAAVTGAVRARRPAAAIFRQGVWHGPRTSEPVGDLRRR